MIGRKGICLWRVIAPEMQVITGRGYIKTVRDEWSAEKYSGLRLPQRVDGITDHVSLEVIGIQMIVFEVHVSRAVPAIAALTSYGIGNKSCCPAIFGRETIG